MLIRRALLTSGMALLLTTPSLGVIALADDSTNAAPLVTVTAADANGANNTDPNPYAPNGVGSPTPQGNGNAPGNGTVGNADDKNPPGQAPNGTDANNGYECDGNSGVGNNGGNPAHSGCSSAAPSSATPTPTPTVTPSETSSPTPSPTGTPSETASPTPSSSTTESASPTPSPSDITGTTTPAPVVCATSETCTPPTQTPHTTTPQPVVCSVGPGCEHPVACEQGMTSGAASGCEHPATCEQGMTSGGATTAGDQPGCALPFTGANTDLLLLVGGEAVLGGILLLLLGNLAAQWKRFTLG